MMEKIKFYQQHEGHLSLPKRVKAPQREKSKIEQDMRELITEINDILDERNKTESEKRQQLKHLTAEAGSY